MEHLCKRNSIAFYEHFKWKNKEQKKTTSTTVNCNAVSAILLKKELKKNCMLKTFRLTSRRQEDESE